jgi:hypothetical protein
LKVFTNRLSPKCVMEPDPTPTHSS